MGLFDRLFGRNGEAQDLKLNLNTGSEKAVEQNVQNVQRQPVHTLQYKHGLGARGWPTLSGSEYTTPVYDLGEIAKALDVESLFTASVRRHRELLLKEGWFFHGKNQETVKYVKKRIREIEMISGEPINSIIREAITNLVAYGNSFMVVKRDANRSSGGQIRMFGKKLDPISAVYLADPTTMSVKKNDFGRPTIWKQELPSQGLNSKGAHKSFNAQDVIHFTLDRKSGFTFGTPYIIPVLDDIRALRRLEELAELVTHKHTFPMFHAKVGTADKPAGIITTPGGETLSEVDTVRAQVDAMPPEGGLVTSERVNIDLMGTNSAVLDLKPYLEYFEARVMGGLRLSGIDLGRGNTANRATAQSVTKNLVDACTEIQNVFAEIFCMKLIDILILEGGFDLTEDNKVEVRFPAIDREEMRAHVNTGTQLFLSNLITEDEFRTEYLGKEPLTEEQRDNLQNGLYSTPEMSQGPEGQEGRESKGEEDTDAKRLQALKNQVENKNRPENQEGKKEAKTQPANDRYVSTIVSDWNSTFSDCDQADLEKVFLAFSERALKTADRVLAPTFEDGYREACLNKGVEFKLSTDSFSFFANKHIRSFLNKLNKKIILMSNSDGKDPSLSEPIRLAGVFDAALTEVELTSKRHANLSYKYGYIQALSDNGIEQVDLVDGDNITSLTISNINWRDLYSASSKLH